MPMPESSPSTTRGPGRYPACTRCCTTSTRRTCATRPGGQSWPNPYPYDQVSFDDKVRFVGDRVAAVAAETPEIAEEACTLIDVTYEVLPAVLSAAEATREGAPVIHDEADSIGIYDAARNLSHHIEGQTVSDEALEAAFSSADHVFTKSFSVPAQQHTPIEPHAVVGWLDEDERLVLRSSTQVPFHLRRMVAPLVGRQVKEIRGSSRDSGGFGSKQEMVTDDIVGLLVLRRGARSAWCSIARRSSSPPGPGTPRTSGSAPAS